MRLSLQAITSVRLFTLLAYVWLVLPLSSYAQHHPLGPPTARCGVYGSASCPYTLSGPPCFRDICWSGCDSGLTSFNGVCEFAYSLPAPNGVNFEITYYGYKDEGEPVWASSTGWVTNGRQAIIDLTTAEVNVAVDAYGCAPGKYQVHSVNHPGGWVPGSPIPPATWRGILNSRLIFNASFFTPLNGTEDGCAGLYGLTIGPTGTLQEAGEIEASTLPPPPSRDAKQTISPSTLIVYMPRRFPFSSKIAEIVDYPTAPDSEYSVKFAVSGAPLVKNGVYVGDTATGPNSTCALPRTAVGLDSAGTHLIVVVVNPGTNNKFCYITDNNLLGSSLAGMAAQLIALGAKNGISLDGGGSAQLSYQAEPNMGVMAPDETKASDDPGNGSNIRVYRKVPAVLYVQ